MRYVIVLALAVAAMLTLTQTSAIQSAAVTNRQSITVTNTSSALLALAPSPTSGAGNSGGTAYLSGSSLLLDFQKGFPGTNRGFLQAGGTTYTDQYRFKNLFTVTNQSGSNQCVSVTVSGSAPDMSGIYLRAAGDPLSANGTQVAQTGGAYVNCHTLTPGSTAEVDIWFAITSTTASTFSFDVRVGASRP
ncbi:MAG TPA: hypothetical protein VNT75_16175 [Symbiobacteriaceae bacterium]|nr:hypothetical protein [Symbiobacteriaceae bacterium]